MANCTTQYFVLYMYVYESELINAHLKFFTKLVGDDATFWHFKRIPSFVQLVNFRLILMKCVRVLGN